MYADDTLIFATNNEDAEIYMQCIEQAGRMYGLQLNKLEVLPVRCEARVRTPNGELVVEGIVSLFGKVFVWQWQYWAWTE